MALDYFDQCGGDYSVSQASRYWNSLFTSGWTVGANGRNGGNSIRINGAGWFGKTMSNSVATASTGFAFLTSGFLTSDNGPSGGSYLCAAYDGLAGNAQVTIGINASGQLVARRNDGTVLGTSALSMVANTFYYIEVLVTVSATVGVVTVNVNGAAWLSLIAQNTKSTANATFNVWYYNTRSGDNNAGIGQKNTVDFCDLYMDTAGTFHGDCRVEVQLPTGNGATNNFTPSAGSNYQNVDENPATDDTDYNSSAAAGDIDLYTYPALATGAGAVKAVMTIPVERQDTAGGITAASAYRISGTNYFGMTQSLSTSYAAVPDIQSLSPATGIAWTVAEVNAAQFGLKRIA